ncbi:MAG: hypothetical protein ACPGYV_00225 [Phycisphaeraceae bacterium]
MRTVTRQTESTAQKLKPESLPIEYGAFGNSHAFSRAQLNAMLVQVRARQLRNALDGDIETSAGFAERAKALRAMIGGASRISAALVVAVLLLPTLAIAQPASPVRTGEVSQQMVQDHRRVTAASPAACKPCLALTSPRRSPASSTRSSSTRGRLFRKATSS